jgi:hypothetical protein
VTTSHPAEPTEPLLEVPKKELAYSDVLTGAFHEVAHVGQALLQRIPLERLTVHLLSQLQLINDAPLSSGYGYKVTRELEEQADEIASHLLLGDEVLFRDLHRYGLDHLPELQRKIGNPHPDILARRISHFYDQKGLPAIVLRFSRRRSDRQREDKGGFVLLRRFLNKTAQKTPLLPLYVMSNRQLELYKWGINENKLLLTGRAMTKIKIAKGVLPELEARFYEIHGAPGGPHVIALLAPPWRDQELKAYDPG